MFSSLLLLMFYQSCLGLQPNAGDDYLALQTEVRLLSKRFEGFEREVNETDVLKTKINTLSNGLLEKDIEIKELRARAALLEDRVHDISIGQRGVINEDRLERNVHNEMVSTTGVSNKTLEKRLETLEELSKMEALRSCFEYSTYGITKSGLYYIDPDGQQMGFEPFKAYCNFEASEASTEIIHDHELAVEIAPCVGPKCFELKLEYNAPMDQISALKEISKECTQYINFDCFLSGLSSNDHPIGFWLNKDGEEEVYYVGANGNMHICSCGVNQNCSGIENDLYCNCDYQIPLLQHDNGTITNQEDLPITGFRYGEMVNASQFVAITIGRLSCEGLKRIVPTKIEDSCSYENTTGLSQTTIDMWRDQYAVFCKMFKGILGPVVQRHIGGLSYNDVL